MIEFQDNQPVIDLVSKKPRGLLIQLEEQGLLGRRANNKALLQVLGITYCRVWRKLPVFSFGALGCMIELMFFFFKTRRVCNGCRCNLASSFGESCGAAWFVKIPGFVLIVRIVSAVESLARLGKSRWKRKSACANLSCNKLVISSGVPR